MKRIFFVSVLLVLILAACLPAAAPSPTPLHTAATSTAAIPSATPANTQKAPPTPTILPSATPAALAPNATQTAPNCAAFPGFPACGGSLPLSGRLAVFDSSAQMITLLDFSAKLAWKIIAAPQTQSLEWLDGGNFLVAYDRQDVPSLAWANPVTSKTVDLPRRSPQGMPVFSAADGSTAWLEMKDTHFVFHIRLGQSSQEQVWPAGLPGDQIHHILGWVPGTKLLLAGVHFSGNSTWLNGSTLYTLDPASGMIKEMEANLRLGASFRWHPSQPGLMVFGDSRQSAVMGAPRLATLDVISGKIVHLIGDGDVSSSYPSWTVDGTAIFHAASKVGVPAAANDPFGLPAIYLTQWPGGTTRRLTNPAPGVRDDWVQMLPDSRHFLYLRVPDGAKSAELRLGTLDGSLDALVGSGLGPVPALPMGPGWASLIAYAP